MTSRILHTSENWACAGQERGFVCGRSKQIPASKKAEMTDTSSVLGTEG